MESWPWVLVVGPLLGVGVLNPSLRSLGEKVAGFMNNGLIYITLVLSISALTYFTFSAQNSQHSGSLWEEPADLCKTSYYKSSLVSSPVDFTTIIS